MYVPIATCGQLRPQRSQRSHKHDIAAGWTRSRRRSLPAIALGARERPERRHRLLVEIRDREVGVATEMLLTKAEHVSDDEACAAGVGVLGHDGGWLVYAYRGSLGSVAAMAIEQRPGLRSRRGRFCIHTGHAGAGEPPHAGPVRRRVLVVSALTAARPDAGRSSHRAALPAARYGTPSSHGSDACASSEAGLNSATAGSFIRRSALE